MLAPDAHLLRVEIPTELRLPRKALSVPLKMSALLGALTKSAPGLVVETTIERIVKPLVEEAHLDQVEPSPAYTPIPQTS